MKKISLVLACMVFLLSSMPQAAPKGGKLLRSAQAGSAELFPVQVNGQYGFIDRTGKMVIQPKYPFTYGFEGGVAKVATKVTQWMNWRGDPSPMDATWELIAPNGAPLTAARFDSIYSFSEGLAAARTGKKWGYLDKKGKWAIKPVFDGADSFSQGLAPVRIGKKWGYIDKKGKQAIKPRFDGARSFQKGLAAAEMGQEWGFIDKRGAWAVKPQFYSVRDFSDGLALVDARGAGEREKKRADESIEDYFQRLMEEKGKWGWIDRTGKFIISPQFGEAYDFREGLAAVESGGKWGYVGRTGSWVIEPRFETAGSFSQGLAAVKEGEKWGYIDPKGNAAIAPQFDYAGVFSDGLAPVYEGVTKFYRMDGVPADGKVGFIDKTGKRVIEAKFEARGLGGLYFSKGLAKVFEGDRWGYIDKTGKYVWIPTK